MEGKLFCDIVHIPLKEEEAEEEEEKAVCLLSSLLQGWDKSVKADI